MVIVISFNYPSSNFFRNADRGTWHINHALKAFLTFFYLTRIGWVYAIILLFATFNGYVIFACLFGLTLGYAVNGDMNEEWERVIISEGRDIKETNAWWYEDLDFDE